MITQQVQSKTDSPPYRPLSQIVNQAPAASTIIRYCFDITPSNRRRPVTACPSVPTYAVMTAIIAAQYPRNGLAHPLCASPTKIKISLTRSGNSLTISPRREAFPDASATIPSSMLNQSRKKQSSGATTSNHGHRPDTQKQIPAPAAATIEA